jgi:ribose 5-phosphate isomerase B
MKIIIDADDAAFSLKKVVVDHLRSRGIEVEDLNFNGIKPDATYPEVGYNLAKKG